MEKVERKNRSTQRNIKYSYLFSPPQAGKPTLLFIHGFPSTSYDWYHQINYFQPKGYGLVVPDLLGFGETDKPEDPADFLQTLIAQDMVDILDGESIKDVIAIGHDWGSAITSILSVKHSGRFLGFGFMAVTYLPPREFPPLKTVLESQKQQYGRPLLGYWSFFGREDAASIVQDNIDLFLDLIYPADPEVWKQYMNLPGEWEKYIEQKKGFPRAPYLTPEHYDHIRRSLINGGLNSPLNWYRSNLQGVNNGIMATVTDEDDIKIKKPAFLAAAKYDYVLPFDFAIAEIKKYATAGLTTVEFETGHWLALQKPEEFNKALDHWVTETFKSG